MRLIDDKTVNTQKQVGGTQGSVCAHSTTLRVFVYVCLCVCHNLISHHTRYTHSKAQMTPQHEQYECSSLFVSGTDEVNVKNS